jgi:hypothetical protein
MTRSILRPLAAGGSTGRKALAAALILSLAIALVPLRARAATPGAQRAFVFRDHDRRYHLDLSELNELWSVVAGGAGEAAVVLRVRQPDPGAPAPFGWPPLVLDPGHELDAVVPLRPHETAGMLDEAGRPLDPAAWEEVVLWSLSADPRGITSTLTAGDDEVVTRIPRTLFDPDAPLPPAAGWVELSVNGVGATVGADELRRLRELIERGETVPAEAVPEGLATLEKSFRDLPGFVNRVHRLYLAEARMRTTTLSLRLRADDDGSRCTALCLSCAGSLLLSIGAYIALIASCGGALVTGGATAIACIASFVGVQGTHFAMLGSCGRCFTCNDRPRE